MSSQKIHLQMMWNSMTQSTISIQTESQTSQKKAVHNTRKSRRKVVHGELNNSQPVQPASIKGTFIQCCLNLFTLVLSLRWLLYLETRPWCEVPYWVWRLRWIDPRSPKRYPRDLAAASTWRFANCIWYKKDPWSFPRSRHAGGKPSLGCVSPEGWSWIKC